VTAVEVACVAAVEKLHSGRQIGLGRFDEQVLVVIHQRKGMQPPAMHRHRPPQPIETLEPIVVVAHDRTTFDSPRHHMVVGARELDSQWSGHDDIVFDWFP